MNVTLGNTILHGSSSGSNAGSGAADSQSHQLFRRPNLIVMRRLALLIVMLLPGMAAVCAQNNPIQPLKPMARNADPAFEAAVIKPADPNDHNNGFHLDGHRIFIENMSMTSLICFAYSIQKSQIVDAPRWFDEQPWDIQGVPDVEGAPNWQQYRLMLQKLLSSRFSLQMHHDKRELLVYTLTVAKGGPKLRRARAIRMH